MQRWLYLPALLVAIASSACAGSLDFPVRGAGISFGNSANFRGIRFNAVDRDVEDLSGLGLTFWKPRPSPEGRMRGIYVGIVGQRADEVHGLGIGLVGTSVRSGSGIFLAGLGLAFGAQDDASGRIDAGASGILIAGLGIGGESLRGIAIAGLGIGADRMTGIAIGGLGMGADAMRGIGIGGLGIGGDSFTGVGIGGLGLGADVFKGIGIGGLGVGADTLHGIVFAGLGCGADEMRGLAVGGLCVRAGELSGAGVSAYTRVRGTQHGITIGLVNIAHALHGVQLGVVNYAGNNPAPFKVLPVINVNFRDS